jgi:hypothetical protein
MVVSFIGGGNRKTTHVLEVTDKLYLISHNVVSSTPHLSGIQTHNFSGDSVVH